MYFKQTEDEKLRQEGSRDLTPSQYRAAELGFYGLLRRKGMGQFLDNHGEDLLQQACFEYTRMIRAGKEVRKPVAWIVLCAWSRTKRILEQPNWRPRMVSTESVGEFSGDGSSGPEEDFLDEDRYRKVREAVEQLPEYQRELLSLSYFEGESVREAARKLDWTPSKAQRAHEAAQRALLKHLDVESSDALEIAAGLAAFLSFAPDGCAPVPQLVGGFEAAVDSVARHVSHLGERGLDLVGRAFGHGGRGGSKAVSDRMVGLGDLGRRAATDVEHGPAGLLVRAGRRVSDFARRIYASGGVETTTAAADGGVRAAEACKAIAAVCVIGGGAIAGGSALLGHDQQHRPAATRSAPAKSPPAKVQRVWDAPPSESDPTPAPVVIPTGPQERAPHTGGSGSRSSSSETKPKNETDKASRSERQAQEPATEESTAETTFDASQIAAVEEEERRSSSSSWSAASSTERSLSNSAKESAATTTSSPKVRAEEQQAKNQFQGLP
jgi:RNA polymerase sigma factor (sigma-70 family)